MKALYLLLAAVIIFPGLAHADPLTPEQLEKIVSQLDQIEETVKGKRLSTRASAVDAFRKAASSDKAAYEFYMACVKEINFDRRGARFSEFRDWRDRNEGKLKDKANMTALRLQLQYLVLTLRKAEGVEMELIVPELESFVTNIVANIEVLEGTAMRTLRQPVNQTIFAQLYELDRSLRMDNWSYTPGSYDSVYQKTLLPYYRVEHPEMLAQAWDRLIDMETRVTQFTQMENTVALEKFQTERLPRLHWQRGKGSLRERFSTTGGVDPIAGPPSQRGSS